MDIDSLRFENLVDDVLLINVDKLTDSELDGLAENIQVLMRKIENEVSKRCAVERGEFQNE